MPAFTDVASHLLSALGRARAGHHRKAEEEESHATPAPAPALRAGSAPLPSDGSDGGAVNEPPASFKRMSIVATELNADGFQRYLAHLSTPAQRWRAALNKAALLGRGLAGAHSARSMPHITSAPSLASSSALSTDTPPPSRASLAADGDAGGAPGPYRQLSGSPAAPPVGAPLDGCQALLLRTEHWLEVADPRHRYGSNLRGYFDYWLSLDDPYAADIAPPLAVKKQPKRRPAQTEEVAQQAGPAPPSTGQPQQQQQQQPAQQASSLAAAPPGAPSPSTTQQASAASSAPAPEGEAPAAEALSPAQEGEEGGHPHDGGHEGEGLGRSDSVVWTLEDLMQRTDAEHAAAQQAGLLPTTLSASAAALGGVGGSGAAAPAPAPASAAAPAELGQGAAQGAAAPGMVTLPVSASAEMRRSRTAPGLAAAPRGAEEEGGGEAAHGDGDGPAAAAAAAPGQGEGEAPGTPGVTAAGAAQGPQEAAAAREEEEEGEEGRRRGGEGGVVRRDPDQSRDNFFRWLDHGPGQHVDLGPAGGPSRAKLEAERVIYLTPEQLAHYEVVVEPGTGRLCYRLSGVILHTAREEGAPVPWVPTPHPAPPPQQQQEEEPQGQAGGGTAVDGAGAQQGTPGGSAMEKWIYVTDVEGRLYVHPKVRGKFHHSSFLRGAAVLAAGAMSVNQGRLVKLTADSGHYWPQPIHFRWLYSHLEAQGADLSSLEGIQFRTKH